MITLESTPFVNGLGFAEAPRWHAGALWISDIVRRRVLRVAADGSVETVVQTPSEPSGLGWLPDDSLLVVQMEQHEVWRLHEGKLRRYSGTAPMTRARLNDMVVDRRGRAWVSNFGFEYEKEKPRQTNLVCIDPGGHAYIAADGLWCPNGMALDAAQTTLYVGQSAAADIVQFTIGDNGVLRRRAVFGTLPDGAVCDGLCLDAAGALWIASPTSHEFLRMEPGGAISHRVETGERHAIACVLGSSDRRTLFCLTSDTLSLRQAGRSSAAAIGMVTVDTPGAGTP